MKKNKLFLIEFSKVLGPIPAKEALLGSFGYKISRLGINPTLYDKVICSLKKYNIKYVIGNYRYICRRDIGKGGWSNKFKNETHIKQKNSSGDYLLYISDSFKKAKAARDNEENEKEAEFGEDLGIPPCCAKFYLDNSQRAMEKQNDFVLYVLENTLSDPPYNYWNNYVAQYFGYSLLSFFPCSFDCKKSIGISKRIYEILSKIYPDFANKFLYYQKHNLLYTEYRGIYLFENTKYKNGIINYRNSTIHSTIKNSSIYKSLIKSDKLLVYDKNFGAFFKNNTLIREIKGENIALCIFR